MADTPIAAAAAQAVEATKASETQTPQTSSKPAVDPNEAFARKERQIRAMQQKLAEEKKALQAKITQYETGYIPKERLKSEGINILLENGLTFEDLTNQVLAQPNDPASRALMAKVRELEAKQQAIESQAAERESAQTEQAKKQISLEVKQFIHSNDYELIKADSMEDAVDELIFQTFEKDGYIMDYKEAADAVEAHLEQQYLKAAQYGKIKSKLQKPEAPAPEKAEDNKQPQTPKTLTTSMPTQPGKKLTQAERIERAKAAFYGKLTS